MNILFLSRRFYPEIGGVEKHIMEVGKLLVKKGHRVAVMSEDFSKYHSEDNSAKTIGKINGIEVQKISVGKNNWFKKFRIWRALWRLRHVIKDADIIHCHDVFFWYLPFRFIYPKKPVFMTFHGYESYPISKKAILIRKVSEKLTGGNICIGDYIQKWYGTRATFVSYGAVDVATLNKEQRTKNKIEKESAVFIGRLDEQTSILTYVKAFEILKKTFPRFKLLVVGDGKYRHVIEKKVSVLGFKDNTEQYFQKYHFAFVSRYLTIFEAMASKRLVFCVYDNPLKEDYCKLSPFGQWIIMADNEKVLSEKVTYYLNYPDEEKKLVAEAYKWVKGQTWEKMVKLYLELWKKKK